MDGTIFRGIKGLPIDAQAFLSHVEHPDLTGDPTDCEHWGLSVWASQDDADHARRVHRYMRRWYIAAGAVSVHDGKFLPTPRDTYPEHCTFWKAIDRDISGAFAVVLEPIAGPKK